jgi:putative ABC transport system permease protein
MVLANALQIAVDTLWAHKLRSSLTVLGIVIGIAAVVLVGSALQGLNEYAAATTAQAFGSNTFLISQIASVGNLSRKELADKQRKNPEIYRREAEALSRLLSNSMRTAAVLRTTANVKSGNKTFLASSVTGTSSGLEAIRDIRLSQGRFFTEEENRRARPLAVIGQDLVDELFPLRDPLGKTIVLEGRPFVVVGVQEKQGSTFGASQDRYVWIPLLAYEKIWGSRNTVTIYAQPREGVDYDYAQDEARASLRALRRLRPGADDNFDLLVPESGRNFLSRLTSLLGIAIIPISSVALFVAGIVVMNMMLVSVTERTREIGIRMSLGALRRDILAQVLLESTILTSVGGSAGLLLSYLGTFGLSGVIGSPVSLPLIYAVLAVSVSAAIGITAGLYPAYLASRMQPIEALRSET